MGRYTPAARIWVDLVVLAASAATILAGSPLGAPTDDWIAFVLLALCGATAHLFPIRSAFDGASYRLTNVLMVAGAVILPAELIALLPLVAMTPDSVLQRRRPGALTRWAFNVSQTVLATQAAGAWVRWSGASRLESPLDLAALLVAAAVFTLLQDLLVGVVITLNSRTSLLRADTLAVPALLGDGLIGVLGITVGGLWLARPVLLLAVLPVLVIAHRLTRTAHLAQLAQIDVKTGLHNSRHFEAALEEELSHSRRLGRPLSILFADLDLLRQVNNRYGHLAGDRVLREVSNLLPQELRPGDIVARFGGEEFVALLPGTEAEEGVRLAERVRTAVARHRFALDDGTDLRCTVSIGVATCPDDGADVTTLIKQADLAMYRAKQTRNAVARAQVSLPVPPASASAPTRPLAPAATAGRQRATSLVLWATVGAGVLATAGSLWLVQQGGGWTTLLPFVILALAAELFPVRVFEANVREISFSFTIAVTMAAITVYPPGAPLVSLAAAIMAVVVVLRQRSLRKALFNLAAPTVAAAAAAWGYALVDPGGEVFTGWDLAGALTAVLLFSAANFGIVTLMISLSTSRSLPDVLRETAPYVPTKVFLGLTGAFLGAAHMQLGVLGALMFAVPVLLMRFTLVFYAGRSQQTLRTLEHQALHDPVTGLPNRTCLRDRLQQEVLFGHRERAPLALLVLDLDRFKHINETFGHHYGDLLLREVGRRFRGALRECDTIARLGGDEFAVLLPGTDVEGAIVVVGKLVQTLEHPCVLEGYRLDVEASVGITVYPDHGADADTLLRRADVAMYVAKRTNSGYAVYTFDQDRHIPGQLALASELRSSIDQDDLVLYYQPEVEYGTRRVMRVEALVRWRHPQQGLVPPDRFIPLAEQTGLIKPLTLWVLDAALRQCRAWQEAGLDIPVAVNLSMRNLHDPQLPETIARLLAAWGLSADRLAVEITESGLMADPTRAMETLTRLRTMGLRIAIDDFGTGYSSLAYLKRLPVDELKIDKSFVLHMAQDENDAAIVRSTVGLGHDLGLTVVAEGVENRSTWDLLAALGCDRAQGYYVSRPMPAVEFARWCLAPAADEPAEPPDSTAAAASPLDGGAAPGAAPPPAVDGLIGAAA